MRQDMRPLPRPYGCFHRGPQDGSLLHVPASSSPGSSTSISSCSLGSPVPGLLCGLLSPDSRQMVSRAAAPYPSHARAPVPRPLPGAHEPKSSAGQAHTGALLTALLRPTRGHSSVHGMVLTPGPARLPPRQLPNHPALQGVGSHTLWEEPPPNLQLLHRYTHTRTPLGRDVWAVRVQLANDAGSPPPPPAERLPVPGLCHMDGRGRGAPLGLEAGASGHRRAWGRSRVQLKPQGHHFLCGPHTVFGSKCPQGSIGLRQKGVEAAG